MRLGFFVTSLLFSTISSACDGSPPTTIIEVDASVPRADAGACGDRVREFATVASPHVAETEMIEYGTNPPTSGPHYARWARWNTTYDSPILPREHWVHNLEHGGVVFLYSCPGACPDVVAALEAVEAALPADAKCVAPVRTRTLVARDLELPAGVTVAAAAWGAHYTATCVDPPSLRAFYMAHVAKAPEDLCGQGSAP